MDVLSGGCFFLISKVEDGSASTKPNSFVATLLGCCPLTGKPQVFLPVAFRQAELLRSFLTSADHCTTGDDVGMQPQFSERPQRRGSEKLQICTASSSQKYIFISFDKLTKLTYFILLNISIPYMSTPLHQSYSKLVLCYLSQLIK